MRYLTFMWFLVFWVGFIIFYALGNMPMAYLCMGMCGGATAVEFRDNVAEAIKPSEVYEILYGWVR